MSRPRSTSIVALLMLAACTSATAARDPTPTTAPVSKPTATVAVPSVGSPTSSPAPAVVTRIVTADWTREIEAAVGGRDVSVAVGANDRISFEHAGGELRIPASNQKLLTSMAALAILGPDHRFPTVAAARRPVGAGVIRGDLWLVGSGDPEVNAASLARLADAVASAGVLRITGGVIGDTAAFSRSWWAPGWVPGLSRSYVTRTTALAFDGNAGRGNPRPRRRPCSRRPCASEGSRSPTTRRPAWRPRTFTRCPSRGPGRCETSSWCRTMAR